MNLLPLNTSVEDVLEEFPMLEDMGSADLAVMRSDCLETTPEEDAPSIRAIDILLKHIEKGDYYPKGQELNDQ